MVALWGICGVGKTRLAREFVQRLESEHVWVDLRAASDIDEVNSRVDRALQLFFDLPQWSGSLRALASVGGVQKLTVVLDGFEASFDEWCQSVAGATTDLPSVRWLVTSRQRPTFSGVGTITVQTHQIQSLRLPATPDDERAPAHALLLQLVTEPGKNGCPGLSEEDRAALLEVTQLLGGLPLAVILLSERLRIFGPSELCRQLRDTATGRGGMPSELSTALDVSLGALSTSVESVAHVISCFFDAPLAGLRYVAEHASSCSGEPQQPHGTGAEAELNLEAAVLELSGAGLLETVKPGRWFMCGPVAGHVRRALQKDYARSRSLKLAHVDWVTLRLTGLSHANTVNVASTAEAAEELENIHLAVETCLLNADLQRLRQLLPLAVRCSRGHGPRSRADDWLNRAQSAFPEELTFRHLRALLHQDRGELERAEELFNESVVAALTQPLNSRSGDWNWSSFFWVQRGPPAEPTYLKST